jgi:hypothetical protein
MSDPAVPPPPAPSDGGGRNERTAPPWFDPEVVAREAMSKDPGLSSGLALRMAREAGEILAEDPAADAPELSRRLLMANRETGATPANCIATAAVTHRERVTGAGA